MQVFLSYRRKNSTVANLIYYAMLAKQVDVFIDKHDISAGEFPKQLQNAVSICEYFILIVDQYSLELQPGEADWYKEEIELAIKKGKCIIPIIIDELNWPQKYNWPNTWIKASELVDCQTVYANVEKIEIAIDEALKYMKLSFYKDSAFEILKKSVSNCTTKSITEYILQSKEMTLESNSEIHLLTDNFRNYDFTVIAKMAISRNVANGTKYIYYCTDECRNDFNILRNSVEGFILRDNKSNCEIDCWLRERFLFNERAVIIVKSIHQQRLDYLHEIIFKDSDVGTRKEIEESFDDFCVFKDGNYILDLDFFVEWLCGKRITSNNVEEFITKLKAFDENNNLNDEWKYVIRYIVDLFEISNWIICSKEISPENAKKAAKKCKQYGVDAQIINWLKLDQTTDVKNAIKNMIWCSLDLDKISFTPCFSFSYLISPTGCYEAGCWYTGSTVSSTGIYNENTVAVHDFSRQESLCAKNLFINLLSVQSDEKKKSIDSLLLKGDKE